MASRSEALAETALQVLFRADNLTAEKIGDIARNVVRLAASILVEARRVREFEFNVHWKSRVINVPIAIDRVKDLIDELTKGLRQKVLDIAKPFQDFEHDLKLLAIGRQAQDPAVSKLATAFSEVEDFVAGLNKLVGDVDVALQSALSLTELFDRVLQDLQHLEDIFLSQRSKRTKTTVSYYKRNA